ncbi:RecQ family ATP-dependent DNA helicase [Sediminibacillus halophilus]|uniref:ATP-dependent DNA helicase RecQ n=1 Tax=Sediminibacillus halophilus TaxID=482461 RepID=A0A1G9LU10_9BACI|nr:RecQ family ATP-dependent DNA helicase [Sediminibacillus halophilus]SDL65418.1 ATP-dependent DNA helicase RecQ [Sediminibacillus halophilus]
MTDNLKSALENYFGHQTFREGQREIIEDVLLGKDVLGILPTGSGKSVCYQLPARMMPGAVLVISPLISLMMDQEKQLAAAGYKDVIAFNSFLSLQKKQKAYQNLSAYKLIYASPEMLQKKGFVKKLCELNISLFVVDEAHCISQWGHEFRPDYLKLHQTIEALKHPPVLALSATATPEVQKDISFQLRKPAMVRHVYPMDRENIAFQVDKLEDPSEKMKRISSVLKAHPVPTMVYFSSRNWTEKAAAELSAALPNMNIAFYHGGMEQSDRILIQQQFMNDQLDVICCTSAFGMGINKQNIRLVIHFHLPPQVESFIQEVGRAGRDGLSSISLVLLSPNDDLLPRKLIQSELPDSKEIHRVIHYIKSKIQQGVYHLPELDILLESLQISETKWRFMRYHFEYHGMMDNNQIVSSLEWENIEKKISRVAARRTRYKLSKVNELLWWAEQSECRRKALFAPFQDTIKQPTYRCCDKCDFKFSEWSPVTKVTSQLESFNWKQAFKQIMLQGDRDEKIKSG